MKRYHIEILLFFILFLAFGYGFIMLVDSIKPIVVQPTTERNEWGQRLPDNIEELCEGTILQWSVRCEDISHREQLRKDI